MPYQVLARKYRPLRFADVAGQDHVTRTLQNALEQGRVAHGYIFSGHRGIGKTTIARILASALNCQNAIGSAARPTPEPCLVCDSCREIRQGNAVDVIEIDAATNRGIDEIRELRDAARYRPARDRYKIYILDEAHQITDAAFNALLKTLEEPPEHIVFMMATTEPENIPQTIRSRCQHFSFHAVKLYDILAQLRKISLDENVLADDAALDLLAEAGDGSMRDALSIMDQAIASAPTVDGKPQLSAAEIRDLMGTVPNTVFEEILEHVSANGAAGVLTTANRLLDAGNSPAQIARQFVRYLRNCVVAKIANLTPDAPDTELLQISPDERRRAARSSLLFTEEELTRFMQVMLRTFDDLGFRQEQRFHLELGLLKLVHLQRLLPMEQFLSQLPHPDPNRRIANTLPPAAAATATQQLSAPQTEGAGAFRPLNETRPATGFSPGVISRETKQAPPLSFQSKLSAVEEPASRRESQSTQSAIPPTQPQASSFQPEEEQLHRSSAVEKPAFLPVQPTPSSAPPSPAAPPPVKVGSTISERDAEPDSTQRTGSKGSELSEGPGFSPAIQAQQNNGASTPEGMPAADPEAQPSSNATTDLASLQAAAVEALFKSASQNSAAEQLEEAAWTLSDGELRIQTSLSKPMVNTIFRADTQAIIRGALAVNGAAGLRLIFLLGSVADKPKETKKPRTGSVQARALEHPTVQAAQRLFNAEITNVFDLRKD